MTFLSRFGIAFLLLWIKGKEPGFENMSIMGGLLGKSAVVFVARHIGSMFLNQSFNFLEFFWYLGA